MKKALLSLALVLVLAGCTISFETPKSSTAIPPKATVTVSEEPIQEPETTESISPEEEAFNNSGQAKAIEHEWNLWPIYDNEAVGFSFAYPYSVALNSKEKNEDQLLFLKVSVDKIAGLEGTMGYNEETALKNIEALKNGEYGEIVDIPFLASQKIQKLSGEINAQDFMVFGRFEICDVTLERKLVFYKNGYQVVITLYGDKERLLTTASEYFTTNPENCGEQLIWDFEKQDDFYKFLSTTTDKDLRHFYDIFESITQSFIFTEEAKG